MQSKATIFEFTSYSFEPSQKKVIFNYKTEFSDRGPLFFTETILLPSVPNLQKIPKELLQKLLENLHLILGISYYKFYCATKVVSPYSLSKKETDFWNIVYKKGLGEFFYKNKLDPKTSPKFPFKNNLKSTNYSLPITSRSLVGIGGGKDSIVVAELLKEACFDMNTFIVETQKESPLVKKIIEIIGVGNIKIERHLDQQVLGEHLYNGHIPISAIYAFLGVFSAVLYNYSYVIVGNEYSSNFGNIKYKGLEINHQWSKSYEFEKLFSDFVNDFISPDVKYFSLLRPFYEIRIVKMFARYPKYFTHFSSCNSNFKIISDNKKTLWCGQCPKCIFAFTLLSAYLPKKELLNIFGKNLYEDENLLPLFKDVLGFGTMKPFDCVGTFEEVQTALFLAKKNFSRYFIVRQLSKRAKHHQEVFQTNQENNIPEVFKFLGMENFLIAGLGKEGQVTKTYLQKHYPKLKIAVADAKRGSGYLKRQLNFDIAVKTPGIPKKLLQIPYTTATNIFFSEAKGQNTIIGVTGSKGKSTTASLIYHILKTAGKNVELLGNIGKPMLESLLHAIKKDTIFALELSSYQLDDIKFSPDIAVTTNLFQEHMDYHGNVKNYWQAKKNIVNFQTKDNFFIYNPKDKEQLKWLKDYKGKAIPFSKKFFKTNLIGKHNQNNIAAAISAVEVLGISQKTIKQAVKSFKGLSHRLELVGQFKGVTFINDANATIPEATINAIQSIPNIGTIFLGGSDRGYNFGSLEKALKKYKIKNIVLFPYSGNRMIKDKKGLNILKIPTPKNRGSRTLGNAGAKSMKEAVIFAYQHTKKGQVCLLSCGSPSYSLWKNFEEKGEQFKKFVKTLG